MDSSDAAKFEWYDVVYFEWWGEHSGVQNDGGVGSIAEQLCHAFS
jgi:hypothetical protein